MKDKPLASCIRDKKGATKTDFFFNWACDDYVLMSNNIDVSTLETETAVK